MLAKQNHEPSIGSIMNTSMLKWYAEVDECITISEVIPGTYYYTSSPSYGNVGNVEEGGSTNFDIQGNALEVISVDNSFITLNQKAKITIPKNNDSRYKYYYVGYLMSAAVFQQYNIQVDSFELLSVNHACYEWVIQYNSTSPSVIEEDPHYFSMKKIREMNPNVPGVYIYVGNIAADTVCEVVIPLKIPLSHFTLFRNIKWLPKWMGRITLNVTPSYKNIIIAPVIPEEDFALYPSIQAKLNTENNKDDNGIPVDFGFYQLNQKMNNRILTANFTALVCDLAAEPQTWSCNYQETDNCKIRLASYQLKMDVYTALQYKFAEVPLLFPVQRFEHKNYTQPLGDSAQFNTAMTVCINNCDAKFTVFREYEVSSTQRFVNPGLTHYKFNIDGDFYPRESYDSIDDHRNQNMLLDALNTNNSSLTSMSKDMRTSLQPYIRQQVFATGTGARTESLHFTTGSRSTYILGVPFCDSEVWMGGISTNNSTVQVELVANRKQGLGRLSKFKFAQPVSIFCQDSILKIRSVRPPGKSLMELTYAKPEEILASGGMV
jgi:hypothetical protein